MQKTRRIEWFYSSCFRLACVVVVLGIVGCADIEWVTKDYLTGNPGQRMMYCDDSLSGTAYFFNGEKSVQVLEMAQYINGKKNGLHRIFDANGRLIELSRYRQGQQDGKSVKWDSMGRKLSDDHYSAGLKHGVCRDFENGRIVQEIHFDHGNLEGPHLKFDAAGNIIESHLYRNNQKIQE